MKKFLLILLLPAFALVSCNDDDGYSLDKFWVSMATVENPDDNSYFYLRLDNNDRLWVASTNFYNYRPRTGQRILADYTILNDKPENAGYQHDVKLNDAYNILTKNIFYITPETQDSIGNDPIGVRDIWVGGDYLNIRFFFDASGKTHFINLVRDNSKEYNDGRIHLEFRHNAYDDEQRYRVGGWVSFNLNSLFVQPQEITERLNLTVHVKELDGTEKKYDFIYDPDNKWVSPKEYTRDEYGEGKDINVE